MVASAANPLLAKAGATKFAVEILDGDIIYAGTYASIGSRDHGTAANQGVAQPMLDNVPGHVPAGWVDQTATGLAAGTPPTESFINVEGVIVKDLTITDDAGDITDQARLVYAVDDEAFTLTRPTTIGFPVGITTRFVAVNTFDVLFFSFETMLAIALGGGGKQLLPLGVVVAEAAAADVLLTGIVSPYHGYIVDFYAICASAPADADMSMLLNLELGGTNVTGGVITLDFADTVGLKLQGTAITALNVIHEGDLINVEAATVTAGTVGDGIYNLYCEVELQPGT